MSNIELNDKIYKVIETDLGEFYLCNMCGFGTPYRKGMLQHIGKMHKEELGL